MTPGQTASQTNTDRTTNGTAGTGAGREDTGALLAVDPAWAWARYEPSSERPWSPRWVSHLFRRAGFGASWKQLQEAVAAGPHATIDALVRQPEAYDAFASEFGAHETAAARSGDGLTLDAWWLRRLQDSPWPFLEKMTLFWHGHFAIRTSAVGSPRWMHAHVNGLRKEALSNFPALLSSLADDPAMYTGLGGEQNRKARPNIHFTRPWLEAFTVGPEWAGAAETSNLARAWTGWFVYGGKLRYIEREHDAEPKRLLGHEGPFGRDDAMRLLAEHPATARNLARRLFRAFISESASPPDSLLSPISERLESQTQPAAVVEMMLRSNLFFSENALGQRIKSPVELVVGLMRSLGGVMPSTAVAQELGNLGQQLGEPPTVHGWAGGLNWLNTITLAGRLRLCGSLVQGGGPFGAGLDLAGAAETDGFHTPASQIGYFGDLLLPTPSPDGNLHQVTESGGMSTDSLKTVVEAMIAKPEFQLS